jgi:formylglycine-generating enzyme
MKKALLTVACVLPLTAAGQDVQRVASIDVDRTEVSVGQFRQFVNATGTRTVAERNGGGQTFERGWEQRQGWVWSAPYGQPAADNEPAVHVTFEEAQAYCRWAGKRLPTEAEWRMAAYTEQRPQPPAPFVRGTQYPYPTGQTPEGANCLGDCGNTVQPVAHAQTSRGRGHAVVGTSRSGVNGLYDMGANVWEWAVSSAGPTAAQQPTMGGSWWYGASPMHRDHRATKPRDTAVVYIGFRCVKDAL